MKLNHLLIAAASVALSAGIACAQTPAATATPASPKPPAQAAVAAQPATPAAPSTVSAARVVAKGDLIETARASGQFTTFLKAADATNLTSVLKTNKNLTVFAPTDAAFAALPPGELNRLMADKPQLQKLLTHHVVNARVDSTKIRNARGAVTTVAGDQLQLDGSGEVLLAGNADIIQPDVMASNGVLHVVDKVIVPGAAAAGANAAPASTTAAEPGATPANPAPAAQPTPAGKGN